MNQPRKIPLLVLFLASILAAGTAGYVGGLRRALVLGHRDSLTVLPMVATLIRENKLELALRMTESRIDSSTLFLKRYEELTGPKAAVGDILGQKYTFFENAYKNTAQYINHYPHPDISAPAIAYVQAQPQSKTSGDTH